MDKHVHRRGMLPDTRFLADMPAEDAEVIAQFMAQMIMNGVVPDGSAWGQQAEQEDGRRERNRNQQGEDDEDEAKKYIDIWYQAAIADAKLPGAAGVSGLRAQYDEYLRQIENGALTAEQARALVYGDVASSNSEDTGFSWFEAPKDEDGNYIYTVQDQYADWIKGDPQYGYNTCGIVAAATGMIDLGYFNNFELAFETIGSAALRNTYVSTSGIQPQQYYEVVQAILAAGVNGKTGSAQVFEAENGEEGLQEISTLLQDGNVVIVDILAISSNTIGGTYPVGAQGSPEVPAASGMFAHFTRVIGFEDDGETIVLAEMILPGQRGNSDVFRVSKDDFLAAWQNPEERAILDDRTPADYIAEEVNNWYLVISRPSGQ